MNTVSSTSSVSSGTRGAAGRAAATRAAESRTEGVADSASGPSSVSAAASAQVSVTNVMAAGQASSTGATTGPYDDEDDEALTSSDSNDDEGGDEPRKPDVNPEIALRLASAGPTGIAAAAAISSAKKRKRSHSFETNPSIRKRQQTRLLRKLRENIEEYSLRVGQQAVILVATPGKSQNSFRAFGAQPLEDVVKNLRSVIMSELEKALDRHAPAPAVEDPTRHELPPLVIDGIPTPVEKMTQAQLRAFIPLMLKFSTGRGKPGWGKEQTKPPWWPAGVPWANVRMDARGEDEKQKVSWTHALREIVTNCYKFHKREDLLPSFAEEDETQVKSESKPNRSTVSVTPKIQAVTVDNSAGSSGTSNVVSHLAPTIVQTIQNSDGTLSIVQLEANNSFIQLADGTTAQIHGIAQLEPSPGGVHTLAEVATAAAAGDHQIVEIAGATTGEMTQDGQVIIAGEDGQISLGSGMITVPVPQSMYQQVVSSVQSGENAGIQVLGTPVQLTKLEPAEQVTTVTAPRGLTITPVGTSAASSGGSVIQVVASSSSGSEGTVSSSNPKRTRLSTVVTKSETN